MLTIVVVLFPVLCVVVLFPVLCVVVLLPVLCVVVLFPVLCVVVSAAAPGRGGLCGGGPGRLPERPRPIGHVRAPEW